MAERTKDDIVVRQRVEVSLPAARVDHILRNWIVDQVEHGVGACWFPKPQGELDKIEVSIELNYDGDLDRPVFSGFTLSYETSAAVS